MVLLMRPQIYNPTNISCPSTRTAPSGTPDIDIVPNSMTTTIHSISITVNSAFQSNGCLYMLEIDGIDVFNAADQATNTASNGYQSWDKTALTLEFVPRGSQFLLQRNGHIRLYTYNPNGSAGCTFSALITVDLGL